MSQIKYATVYRKLLRDLRPHYRIELESRRAGKFLSVTGCEELFDMYLRKTSDLFGTQIKILGFSAHEVAIALAGISEL
jgi:hypothetical protein